MRYLLFFSAMLFLLSGCQKKIGANSYGLEKTDTLRVILSTEPPTMDWTKASDTTSAFIQENIMEGLIEFDYTSPTLELEPALATSWTSNADNTKWEFTIREGVVWNDGVPFTVEHVYDGWKRLLSPDTASVYSYFLFSIKNAQKFNSNQITDFSEVGIKVNGNKISVELNVPTNFPYLLTHHSTFPVRMDVIEEHGDRWTNPGNIVSLGAYDLKVWDHDKAIVLERNESYYGEKAYIKNVLAYVIEQPGTALNLYKSREVDALRSLPSSMLKKLKTMPDYSTVPVLTTYYYGFNTKRPPMDNVDLRRAIISAVDRGQITRMLDGGQIPISGWIPKGMFGFDEQAGISFNLEKALEYYKKAGYSKENPAPKIFLSYNTNEDHKRIAENVQAQLRSNLGMTVEIKNEEWKVYLGTLRSNPAHFYRMGWVADYPDPHNFYDLMNSMSDNNYTGWKSKDFDFYLDQALRGKNEEAKFKSYQNASRLLLQEGVAVMPVYSGVSHNLISPRVINFPRNAMDRYPLKKVRLKNESAD